MLLLDWRWRARNQFHLAAVVVAPLHLPDLAAAAGNEWVTPARVLFPETVTVTGIIKLALSSVIGDTDLKSFGQGC